MREMINAQICIYIPSLVYIKNMYINKFFHQFIISDLCLGIKHVLGISNQIIFSLNDYN